ncbi:MAG TPA: carboxypeptidase regulatory-like domain-containing protein [Candidatus Acidoferrales bacterium]|nr:carboxypeptidase regulatory-like domain-containing protein [Candidatus Acidoferrales bacterium]
MSKLCVTLLAVLFAAMLLSGQGTTSRITGTVTDPTGAVVPGAQVDLTNEATGVAFHSSTTEAGTYVFEAIQVGNYRIEITARGFKKYVSPGNRVVVAEPTTVNARLEVGAAAESVEVSGAAELVQTGTSGNFGSVIEQRVLQDLPIVGTRDRSPLNLVYTQPGVVATDGNMAGGGIYVHGARDRSWNYTLDGIDNNESSYGGSNTIPARTNPDALAEVQIMTGNGTAEWGRNSGGQVAMVTRSGTNSLHGTGFFFYRTPRLNANEWQNNTDLLGKRQFMQQIPGFSVGGPIRKNKLFFFTNVQFLRTLNTGSFTSTVYTQTARQGIFRYVSGGRNQPAGVAGASVDSSGNPLAGLNIGTYNVVTNDPQHLGQDPTVMKQVNMMPLPNNFTVGDGLNTAGFNYVAPQYERQHDITFKVDYVLTSHQTIFARVYLGEQDTNCDQANAGQPAYPGGPCLVNTTRSPRNMAYNWRWSPTVRTTNELVVGQQHYVYNFVTPTADASVPDLTWYSQVTLPISTSIGNLRTITTYQAVDNFSYVRGAHNIKMGTNLRLVRHQDERGSVGSWNVTPIVDFSTSVNSVDPATFNLPAAVNQSFDLPTLQSMINQQLGRVGTIYQGFVSSGSSWATPGTTYKFDARYPELDFYWQDNWKVRPNFTVDLGLRWEMRLTPSDANNTIKRPNQGITIGTAPSTSLTWQTGSLYNSDRNNLGPSAGFAWDPTGKGKMSIRANYRLAFDRINTFLLSSKIFQNLPGSSYTVANTAFGTAGGRLANLPSLSPSGSPSDLLTPPNDTTNAIYVVDPAYHTPKTHMWGAGFQYELFKSTKLEVDYVGRHALNLLGAYNLDDFGTNLASNGFLDAFKIVQAGGQSPLMNQLMGVDSRIRAGETGSDLVRRLYASNLSTNAAGALAKSIGTRFQNGKSINELAGFGPYFFVPYPQFMGGMYVIDSNDYSHYNGLEIRLQRAFSSGIAFQFAYTLSKSMDTRSFDPTSTVVSTGTAQSAGNTPFDLHNRYGNYALSDFDRRHVVQGNWTYELPFGNRKKFLSSAPTALNYVVGGWEIAGFLTVFSPRPFTVWSGQYTSSSVVTSTANCSSCSYGMGTVFDDAASGYKWFFNQSQIAGFTNPAPGSMGNTGRNGFAQPWMWDMDMSLLKRIQIKERHRIEFRAEAYNLTNSVSFGYPTTSIASSTFGRIKDNVVSGSRKIQLGLKYSF